MLQLSALSICDATPKDSHLIRKAVEALKHCDMEQKIHLKCSWESENLNNISVTMSQDQTSRKLHPAQNDSVLNVWSHFGLVHHLFIMLILSGHAFIPI